MASKNEEQRIVDLQTKIKTLDDKKKVLQARLKSKERKERTRRLIQIGAVISSMGIDNVELAEKFKNSIMDDPQSKQRLTNFIANNDTEGKEN